jgi:hypothetical protein
MAKPKHPNPVTAEQLAHGDTTRTADLETALAKIDQEALFTVARTPLTAFVWNREDTINGIAADKVLASLQPPTGGAVVGVSQDGPVRLLQPTDPTTGGAIPQAGAQQVADRLADELAADTARSQAIQQVPPALLVEAPSPTAPVQPTVEELAAQVQQQNEVISNLTDTVDGLVSYITEGAGA